MQTLAFWFICQGEDIWCVGRKTHIENSILWRQGVSIQALLQMGKCQILIHSLLKGDLIVRAEGWGLGWGSKHRQQQHKAAASSCGRALVWAWPDVSPRGSGGPAQVDVKMMPAPSSSLQKACEQLLPFSFSRQNKHYASHPQNHAEKHSSGWAFSMLAPCHATNVQH